MLGVLGYALRSSAWRGLATLPRTRFLHSAGYLERAEKMVENDQNHVTHVLFCGFHWPASQKYTREYLESYPYIQVDEVPPDDVPNVISKYHICVVKNQRVDSQVIARADQMKLLMQFGVGLEGVDVDAATRNGIKVARIPGSATGNSTSCAEMAIYLMLGLLRKQKEMDIAVKQKHLGEPLGDTLFGKTEITAYMAAHLQDNSVIDPEATPYSLLSFSNYVFILGFGDIGVDLAKRLRPFGVRILATKRRWTLDSLKGNASSVQSNEIDGLVDKKGGPENLHEFAGEADIVVTCLTLNAETAGIVDGKFLSSMRKGSLLVNIARGGLLDYKNVLLNLKTGHLGGLGIDVAWTEPFDPEDPILTLPNVLITPHVAGVTEYSYRKMAKVVGDCALQLHAGVPLTGIEFVN